MGVQTAVMSSNIIRAARPAQGTQALRQLSALAAPARGARTLMANKINANKAVLKMSNGQRYIVGRRESMRCYAAAATEVSSEVIQATGSDVRVRFAPSPTGNLHVGGARTALFNWLYARRTGGKFVMRVEDTDQARSTLESEQALIRDLKWLGLDWDEGPDKPGDCGPYRQSERSTIYKEYADKLVASGAAYPCFCTDEELAAMKAEQEAKKLPPKYAGKWATASAEEVQEMMDKGVPYVYRFRVPANELITIQDLVRGDVTWNTDTLGDFVLIRSNGFPVYNFCVAIDDATMGITHVLRAEEHLPNTLRQMLVYKALGFKIPQFGHMSLILAPDRSKLSKRHGASSVGDFKDEGYLAPAMVNYLSLLGWNDGTEQEIYTAEELCSIFSIERITKSAGVFDKVKLSWMNGQHLRALPVEEQVQMIGAHLEACGVLKAADSKVAAPMIALVMDSLELVVDAEKQVRPMLGYPLRETMASGKADKVLEDNFAEIVNAVLTDYESGELATAIAEDKLKGWFKAQGKAMGRKGKGLFMPLRIALTGRMQGPEVPAVMSMLATAEGEVAEEGLLVNLDARMAELKAWATEAGHI
eukprot:CAMPEP_0118934974 /NCGR_PEP_ID=MMETSP1169-20130426/14622_1 /TAXON_ID=36882 /ORGANISM="Pyramimonas obovata, Strain CCMP722" /LENGTH=589 /DNA_ID=CAMNT_0006877941 /DNA_START=70 /DNA_END=1839 /DNA_ORIENTATION=+